MNELDLYSPGRFNIIKQKFVKLGFYERELPRDGIQLRMCELWKRLPDVQPVCVFNDNLTLRIRLAIFGRAPDFTDSKKFHFNTEFEIIGQTSNHDQATVSIGAVTFDKAVIELPGIEKRLIKAWQAIYA